MSIVVITIPGEAKQSIVNRLQNATEGSVSLVVVQKPTARTLAQRLLRWWNEGVWVTIEAAYFGCLLRLRPRLRRALSYFRARIAHPQDATEWTAPILETYEVNSPEVLARIQAEQPTVLVVWGSQMLSNDIIASAPTVINLHMGQSPKYRGKIANQYAVEQGDPAHIGATIHEVTPQVDAGNILALIPANVQPDPVLLFQELNTKAEEALVRISAELSAGREVPIVQAGSAKGINLKLKDWSPRRRYQVAKRLLAWQTTGIPPQATSTDTEKESVA